MHEETIYELPAKLSPLLQFYSRYRTNFGDPANAASILRENGATTLGHGEELWNTLPFVRPLDRPGKVLCAGLNYRDHAEEMGLEIPKYPTIFTKISKRTHRPQRRNSDAFCKRNRKHKNRLGGRNFALLLGKRCAG